jgi:predicted DNA-binding protein
MSKQLRTIYLDKEKLERLKIFSAKAKVPQAVIIRAGIDHVLDKYEKQLKGKRKQRKVRQSKGRKTKGSVTLGDLFLLDI